MLNQGYHVLDNLREQGSIMKGTKKRILDFTSKLALSNTVMQLIERRAYQDKFVLFGGMLLTLTIIFFLYLYFVWTERYSILLPPCKISTPNLKRDLWGRCAWRMYFEIQRIFMSIIVNVRDLCQLSDCVSVSALAASVIY